MSNYTLSNGIKVEVETQYPLSQWDLDYIEGSINDNPEDNVGELIFTRDDTKEEESVYWKII